MRSLHAPLVVVALIGSGCGRFGFDSIDDSTLLVTTTEDRLAGPTDISSPADLPIDADGLSLREAMLIASNSAGPDVIRFDPSSFEPGTIITLGSGLPALIDAETEIDASDTDVVLDATSHDEVIFRIIGDQTTIRGFTLLGNAQGIEVQGAGDVVIENNLFESVSGPGIDGTSADGLRIVLNRFVNSGGDAIVVDGSDRLLVEGNTILDPGGRGIHLLDAAGATVDENTIERAGADLMTIVDSTDLTLENSFMVIGDKGANRGVRLERVHQSTIVDNIIDPGDARLLDFYDSSDNHIEGNILDRGDAGVVFEGDSHRNLVFRNVVISSTYDGVYISSSSTDNTVVHNTLFQCSTPIVDGPGDTVLGNNLTATEPAEFVEPGAYDFHLVAGSQFVDAAADMGYDLLPQSDERFLGSAPDLGAVETR